MSLTHNSEHITGQENIASIVDDYYNMLLGTTSPRQLGLTWMLLVSLRGI